MTSPKTDENLNAAVLRGNNSCYHPARATLALWACAAGGFVQLLACAKVSVCLTLSADAHDHRTLPCPAPCRARTRGAIPAARPARRATRLRWAVPSNCAGRGRARDPIQWPHAGDRYRASHRVLPARLPSYADYILRLQDIENPGASRSCCAF